ncbi:hypothetical protein Salat_1815700 [Sesamum alatum]|uniref:Hydroxyproline-rich glycoprotein family protein n=1 Tax=Sesamum alatum TaxID=300844 RepID=A0AAE1Y2B6_9LAMI|nr:hypothetical protein Salat_1815700 [Sesamum alatum]
MRGKSCNSSESENGPAPHLSGAYIRSLVKQLTSSRTKDWSDSSENSDGPGGSSSGPADGVSDKQAGKPRQGPQQHKKQVRRRAHTSRPYQDSLLNMAEARREIVTALKLHRAAMKQAREKQQVLESGPEVPPASSHHQFSLEQEEANKLKSRRNPRIYAADSFAYSPGFYSPYSWPVSPIAPLNLQLPTQTLGLNLNLEDFENLDTTAFHCSTNPSSNFSSSSPSTTSSSPALSEEIPQARTSVAENGDSGLLFGDQWNHDSVKNSQEWFKFLKSMEIGPPEEQKDEDFVTSPFDQVMEFPAWLNANENLSQHVDDFSSDDYFQDLALPCMDIQEIEGMDGDWLS